MALQDLTPQLRTRLSRVERVVGWFVFLAVLLLAAGFAYYVYHTAERKGWFTPKFKYRTSLNNAAGLKEADPVMLMGFPVGEITKITPNEPTAYYGITIDFTVKRDEKNYPGYIWDDSQVKVTSDLLGKRSLEITKGQVGLPTLDEGTNKVPVAMLNWHAARAARKEVLTEVRSNYPGLELTDQAKFNWFVGDGMKARATDRHKFYTNLTEVYWIQPQESPALNERLEAVANQVEAAMPNILNLTNRIGAVLENSALLTSNLNVVAQNVTPLLTDLRRITAQLNGPGTLGDWLIPTNLNQSLTSTMGKVDSSMNTVDTNLPAMFAEITATLENLSAITSNLNAQVAANTNILSNVSKSVVDADDLVQGLKRHWLLRSAFKTTPPPKTNAPPALAPVKK